MRKRRGADRYIQDSYFFTPNPNLNFVPIPITNKEKVEWKEKGSKGKRFFHIR